MPTDERSDGGSLEPETVAKIEEVVEEKVSERIGEALQDVTPPQSSEDRGPWGDPGSKDGQVEGPGSVQPQ